MEVKKSSRRDFMKRAAGAVALFNIVPRYVVAGSGQVSPNEKIRVAAIGAAGRAVSDIYGLADNGADIIGLCDVDTRRVGKTRERFKNVPFFTYYKEMLDKLDNQIDAVMIGVPDHWHATMAIECLKRGKHVECEKPLAQCYSEVDEMIKVAKASGKVNQAMAHGLPVVATHCAVEGMHLHEGEDVLVADDPAAFARAVLRLYDDEALWARLAANGRASVASHFSADAARDVVRALFLE